MRVPPDEYRALDLRAHRFMRDVPLHDVSVVDLTGGGSGRTMSDVQALLDQTKPSPVVSALMAIRCRVGDALGWDSAEAATTDSYVSRVTSEDRLASDVPPGTQVGGFRVLYRLPREALSEIRNATVHAFLCTVLVPTTAGYRFYWAVYVAPTSWLTPAYLAVIEPFRRFIVYPSMLRRIRDAWVIRYSPGRDQGSVAGTSA